MAVERPPPALINALRNSWGPLFQALSWVMQAQPGLALTSWWRSRAHNMAVGGRPTSQHLIGTAFDLVGPEPVMQGAEWYARNIGWEVLYHQVYGGQRHLHLQAYRAGTAPAYLYQLTV